MSLSHHTVRSYDQQLQHLQGLVLQAGGEVRKLVLAARESLHTRSESAVKEAKAADRIINELDEQIEEAAIVILALQNPMAVDLRFVISIFKVSGMLERAGDLAKNTVKRSANMSADTPPDVIRKMEAMCDITVEMLDLALEAFVQRDTEKATEVWRRDDEIDDLYHEVFTTLQNDMIKSPAKAEATMHAIFAAKNLERLADYTTNIVKTIYYVASGKRVDKAYLKQLATGTAGE
jgi:phosphate transport system protein